MPSKESQNEPKWIQHLPQMIPWSDTGPCREMVACLVPNLASAGRFSLILALICEPTTKTNAAIDAKTGAETSQKRSPKLIQICPKSHQQVFTHRHPKEKGKSWNNTWFLKGWTLLKYRKGDEFQKVSPDRCAATKTSQNTTTIPTSAPTIIEDLCTQNA